MAQLSYEVRNPEGAVYLRAGIILASARALGSSPKKVAEMEADVLNGEALVCGEAAEYQAVRV